MRNSFLKEIKKCLPLTDFFCVQIFTSGGLVQEVTKIEEYEAQKVTLLTKAKKRVRILGNELKITKLCEGDLIILGEIVCVEVESCER